MGIKQSRLTYKMDCSIWKYDQFIDILGSYMNTGFKKIMQEGAFNLTYGYQMLFFSQCFQKSSVMHLENG